MFPWDSSSLLCTCEPTCVFPPRPHYLFASLHFPHLSSRLQSHCLLHYFHLILNYHTFHMPDLILWSYYATPTECKSVPKPLQESTWSFHRRHYVPVAFHVHLSRRGNIIYKEPCSYMKWATLFWRDTWLTSAFVYTDGDVTYSKRKMPRSYTKSK